MRIGRSVEAVVGIHEAKTTGVHGVASDYLAKTSQAAQTLGDAEIPAAIARDTEVTAEIATHAGLATVHQDAPALIATHAGIATAHHSKSIDDCIVGDDLQVSADTERFTTTAVMTKVKEITLARAGTYRIKFAMMGVASEAQIYRNGSPVGTLRTGTGVYVTHSEDIAGWGVNDGCELWGRKQNGNGSLKEFRVYIGNTLEGTVVLD